MEFPFQMQQFPEELDWFAARLLRECVSTVLTVGVYTGGVEWWLCKRYQEAGRHLKLTCVDINDHPDLWKTLALIRAECPLASVEFIQADIHNVTKRLGRFDAIFLDGDHSEACIARDVVMALGKADVIIAIHDIVEACTHTHAVAAAWKALKAQHLYSEEIQAHPELDKGIGIVYVREPDARYGD